VRFCADKPVPRHGHRPERLTNPDPPPYRSAIPMEGRVAQRESTAFTRQGSQVQSLSRPPFSWLENSDLADQSEARNLPTIDLAHVWHSAGAIVVATFRKRGNRWQVQVRRRDHPSITKTFANRSDAERWSRRIERELDLGETIQSPRHELSRIRFKDLLCRYASEVSPSHKGHEAERYRLQSISKRPIGQLSLAQLQPKHFSDYRDERLKVVALSSVVREFQLMKAAFEWAKRDLGLLVSSEAVSSIKLPKVRDARNRRPSDVELTALRLACSHPSLWPIITIAIETGMRRSEIVAMRWEDINWVTNTLHIPTAKNGHPRTIPLTPKATRILEGLNKSDVQVFPISGNAVRLAWVRLKKRAGVNDLRFHDLRHEAVSRFFELGLSIAEVALISGHRDARMLFRYTHLRAETVSERLRELSSV